MRKIENIKVNTTIKGLNLVQKNQNDVVGLCPGLSWLLTIYPENRDPDWGETLFSLASHALRACKDRALHAPKTLMPHFTDFFTDFDKKPTVLQFIWSPIHWTIFTVAT